MESKPPTTSILSKPCLEFLNTESIPWKEFGTGESKARMKILADDPRTGDSTFLLHFPCDYLTSPKGRVIHAFWEEVLILEGNLTDLTLNATFEKGHYACRPPGMEHGPYATTDPDGCTMFVTTRYEYE